MQIEFDKFLAQYYEKYGGFPYKFTHSSQIEQIAKEFFRAGYLQGYDKGRE